MERFLSPSFWNGLIERAVKTSAQTAIAAIGAATVFGAVDWPVLASTVGMAAFLSVLTSFADPDRADTAVSTYVPRH